MKKSLNHDEMCDVFKRYQFKKETQKDIAKSYGVSQSTISNRLKYFIWGAALDYNSCNDFNIIADKYHLTKEESEILVNCGMISLGC